jgi:hypothetical protein
MWKKPWYMKAVKIRCETPNSKAFQWDLPCAHPSFLIKLLSLQNFGIKLCFFCNGLEHALHIILNLFLHFFYKIRSDHCTIFKIFLIIFIANIKCLWTYGWSWHNFDELTIVVVPMIHSFIKFSSMSIVPKHSICNLLSFVVFQESHILFLASISWSWKV